MLVSYNSSQITVFKTVSMPEGVIIEYQFSDNPNDPPLKYIPYVFGGHVVRFKGGVVGDNNDDDWSKNPVQKGKYKWMRVSTDGGKTWSYTNLNIEPSSFKIGCSKLTFTLNAREVVERDDNLQFWVERTNVPIYEQATWTVTPPTLLKDPNSIHNDYINVIVPKGFKDKYFTVELAVGSFTKTEKMTITGEITGSIVNEKLPTVYSTKTPPDASIFPKILLDGVSPIRDGDYCIVIFDIPNTDRYAIPYRYSEKINPDTLKVIGWEPSTENADNHSEIMGSCLQEILANSKTVPSFSAYYGFFQSLVANDAFIKFLGTQYLHITDNGAIYGGGFDKDGSVIGDNSGFHISSDGTVTSSKGRFQEAQVTGNFSCSDEYGNIMHTAKAQKGEQFTFSAPSRWKFSDFRNKVKFQNTLPVTYNGTSYTASRFKYSDRISTSGSDMDEKKREITIKAPWDGVYNIVHTVFGTRARFRVDVNGTTILKIEPRNDSEGVHNAVKQLYLNKGDSVYIYCLTLGVSPIEIGSNRVDYNFKPAHDSIFFLDSSNLAIMQFLDSTEYFLSKQLSCEGFNSTQEKLYTNTDVFMSLGYLDYMYPVATNTRININGESKVVSYISRSQTYIEIVFGDGSISKLMNSDNSEFASTGWYDISGTITLMETLRGIHVQNIFPNKDSQNSTDGTSLGSDEYPFGSIHSVFANIKTISSNQITGNVNEEGTKYKVWGAVAN